MDTKTKILDIAMNLNRIGNWAADDYKAKKSRIHLFLDQTTQYINSLNVSLLSTQFKTTTLTPFLREYRKMERDGKEGPANIMFWAEDMMTWGNILAHRAKLA